MVVDSLRRAKAYRGQIHRVERVESLLPIEYERAGIAGLGERAAAVIGRPSLYSHQRAVLEGIAADQDVFLSLPHGSGMTTASDLAVVYSVLSSRKWVLLLVRDPQKLAVRAERFRRISASGSGDGEFNTLIMQESDQVDDIAHQLPDVVFALPEVVKEVLLARKIDSVLLSSLGLVILEDLDAYLPAELQHLRYLLRAIRLVSAQHGADVKTLLTSSPLASPETTAVEVTGVHPRVVDKDGAPKSGFNLHYWIPPLEAESIDGKALKIRRRTYISELATILGAIPEAKEPLTVGIWHAFVAVAETDLRMMEQATVGLLSRRATSYRLVFFSSPKEVQEADFHQFQLLFVLGLPRAFGDFKLEIGNLVRADADVFVVLPEDPCSHFLLRRNLQYAELSGRTDLVVSANPRLASHYLLGTLMSLDRGVMSAADAGVFGDPAELLQSAVAGAAVRYRGDKYEIEDRERASSLLGSIPFGADGVDDLHLLFEGYSAGSGRHAVRAASLVPWRIFPQGFAHAVGRKYLLQGIEESEGEKIGRLELAPASSDVLRVPRVRVIVKDGSTSPTESPGKVTTFGQVSLARMTIRTEIEGYQRYPDFAFFDSDTERQRHFEQLRAMSVPEVWKDVDAVTVIPPAPSPDATDSLERALRLVLPFIYKDVFETIQVWPDGERLCIASLGSAGNVLLRRFYDYWSEIARRICQTAFDILVACPCADGCPHCTMMFEEHRELHVEKQQALAELGKLLGLDDQVPGFVDAIVRFKRSGLEVEAAKQPYERWREEIFEMFANRFDMKIVARAPLKIIREDIKLNGRTAIGLYTSVPNLVQARDCLPEAAAVDLLAHEYTHNWQYDPGGRNMHENLDRPTLPYDGKLPREGFAQWVSFRVLDFLGLTGGMRNIELYEGDEYGYGFDLMHYIEKSICGFSGVVKFMREGKAIDPENGHEYTCLELLEKSGLKEKIAEKSTTG